MIRIAIHWVTCDLRSWIHSHAVMLPAGQVPDAQPAICGAQPVGGWDPADGKTHCRYCQRALDAFRAAHDAAHEAAKSEEP